MNNPQRITYVCYKYSDNDIILLAGNYMSVCGIFLGDCLEQLLKQLQQSFVGYTIIEDSTGMQGYLAQVLAYLNQQNSLIDLPLDIRGSDFQLKVWQALREIPLGQTISYAKLATKINQPKAIRAVANACASNKLALVIPCHRVIRSSGALAGYRWGIRRKQSLLTLEQAYISQSYNLTMKDKHGFNFTKSAGD